MKFRHHPITETNTESEAELEEEDPKQSQTPPDDNFEMPSWKKFTRKRGQQPIGPLPAREFPYSQHNLARSPLGQLSTNVLPSPSANGSIGLLAGRTVCRPSSHQDNQWTPMTITSSTALPGVAGVAYPSLTRTPCIPSAGPLQLPYAAHTPFSAASSGLSLPVMTSAVRSAGAFGGYSPRRRASSLAVPAEPPSWLRVLKCRCLQEGSVECYCSVHQACEARGPMPLNAELASALKAYRHTGSDRTRKEMIRRQLLAQVMERLEEGQLLKIQQVRALANELNVSLQGDNGRARIATGHEATVKLLTHCMHVRLSRARDSSLGRSFFQARGTPTNFSGLQSSFLTKRKGRGADLRHKSF